MGRNVHLDVAAFIRILRSIGVPYHFVCHDMVQRNMIPLYDGHQILYGTGYLLISQGRYQRITLKLDTYRAIVAMFPAKQYGESCMVGHHVRVSHHVACAVRINHHMRTYLPFRRRQYVQRFLHRRLSCMMQHDTHHLVLPRPVIIWRRIAFLVKATYFHIAALNRHLVMHLLLLWWLHDDPHSCPYCYCHNYEQ